MTLPFPAVYMPLAAPVGPASTGTATPAPTPKAPVEAPIADHTPTPTGTTATTATAPGSGTTTGPANKENPMAGYLQIVAMVLIFVVLYFLLFRGQRKEKNEQKKMLEALKKGDRVMTIGGMIASVVDVRGDEVVLKVDEANNVKARYIKSAIQKVLESDTKVEDKK